VKVTDDTVINDTVSMLRFCGIREHDNAYVIVGKGKSRIILW